MKRTAVICGGVALLGTAFLCLWVPWRDSSRYAWVFDPPYRSATVDVARLVCTVVALLTVCGAITFISTSLPAGLFSQLWRLATSTFARAIKVILILGIVGPTIALLAFCVWAAANQPHKSRLAAANREMFSGPIETWTEEELTWAIWMKSATEYSADAGKAVRAWK